MTTTELTNYRSRAVRALVLLQAQHLSEFVSVWRRARAAGVELPSTKDPNYASLQALLRHVLSAARGYMTWICAKLALPDPEIREVPPVERLEAEADAFLAHVLERWRIPLAELDPPRLSEIHTSRWGVQMSIESMMEHAVAHPIRHSFQLLELIEKKC